MKLIESAARCGRMLLPVVAEEFLATPRADFARLEKLVKQAGITPE